MLAFGQAGVFAVSSDCFVNYFGVTKRRNNFLCNENHVTYGAVLAFGQAGVFAVSSDCCINYFGMTKSVNYRLCNDYFAAYGAVLAFGQTGVFAVSSDCCINYFGVALGCNNALCGQNLATNRALLTFSQARFGTGCSLAGDNFFGMAEHRNCFGLNVAFVTVLASGAGINLNACCRTSRILGDYTLIIAMLLCRNGRANRVSAKCASLSLGTNACASGLRINYTVVILVTKSSYCLGVTMLTAFICTGVGRLAGLITSGSGCHRRLISVSKRRNFFHAGDYRSAIRTLLPCRGTGLGTGRSDCGNVLEICVRTFDLLTTCITCLVAISICMPRCGNVFRIGVLTYGAFKFIYAGYSTRGSSLYAFHVTVSCASPIAIHVGIGIVTTCNIAAIAVLQLCRSNRDLRKADRFIRLHALVGNSICARSLNHGAIPLTDNGCAGRGCINVSRAGIQCTVYNNQSIAQSIDVQRACSAICPRSGSVLGIRRTAIPTPFGFIIDVYAGAI